MDVSRNEESHVSVTTSLFMALIIVVVFQCFEIWIDCMQFFSVGKNIDDKIVVDDTCNIGTYLYKHVLMM